MAHVSNQAGFSNLLRLSLGVALLSACSGEKASRSNDDDVTDDVIDDVTETPDACAALPFRQQALEALADELEDEVGLSPVAVRYPYQGPAYYSASIFDIEPIQERRSVAIVLNGPEDFGMVDAFRPDFEALAVDWATESVVVLLAWPDQYVYRYALDGDELIVLAGELEPCADYPAEDLRLEYDDKPIVLALPKVSGVEIREKEARYRFSDVPERGSCAGSPERVLDKVGGSPSVIEREGTLRMWYTGYSANTGNVFTTSSSDDGATWEPKGWSMDHLSQFAEHSVYANHFGASVIEQPGGYWMFYDDYDFQYSGRQVFARASSTDGIQWNEEVELLEKGEPGSWSARDIGAPHVLEHEGRYFMWYTGAPDDYRYGNAIGLATSDDGTTWTQHPGNPVLAPGKAGAFDDLGVGSPAVRFDGERFVMLYWAATGGGDSNLPQHSSIGLATSSDGIAWERSEEPLTTLRADWATFGFFSPDFVIHDKKLTVFVTGLNDESEPSIGRLECAVP